MPNLIAIHEYVDYGSAIGVLLDVAREHGEETDAEATIKRCIMALSGLPRLDPESLRPKGEWIIEWEYERNYATGEVDETPHSLCPFCGKIDEYGVANNDPYWAKPHNFCPNCGADMRGEVA